MTEKSLHNDNFSSENGCLEENSPPKPDAFKLTAII